MTDSKDGQGQGALKWLGPPLVPLTPGLLLHAKREALVKAQKMLVWTMSSHHSSGRGGS